jgi:hypothetical protein
MVEDPAFVDLTHDARLGRVVIWFLVDNMSLSFPLTQASPEQLTP